MQKIISIHIPKTAGTSFRYTLIDVYGADRVMSFYHPDKSKLTYKIPGRIQVIHGHITIEDCQKLIAKNPEWKDAIIISWARKPVSRFISNYFYMKQIIYGQLDQFKETPDLKKRMVCTLEDFIKRKNERNEIPKYISQEDLNANRFEFIGQVENYEDDLKILAYKLQWKSYAVFRHNTTKNKKEVDPNIKDQIKSVLAEEIDNHNALVTYNHNMKQSLPDDFLSYNPQIQFTDKLDFKNRQLLRLNHLLGKVGLSWL